MATTTIHTTRLTITPLDPDSSSHTKFLVQIFNEPSYLAAEGPTGINTPAQARTYILTRCMPQLQKRGFCRYIMHLRRPSAVPVARDPSLLAPREEDNQERDHEDADQPVGIISLMQGDAPESYTAPDVGFCVLEAARGKGYATEGARAVLEHVRERFGVENVFGFTDEENMPSRRVLERLGFENRGVRELKAFGSGRKGLVYTSKGMGEDLRRFNL